MSDNISRNQASHLWHHGYVCVPIDGLAQIVTQIRTEFDQTMRNFPEFKSSAKPDEGYVCGGFSALANAASFHNPLVRMIRQWAQHSAVEVFRELKLIAEMPNHNLEQIIDRMLFRPKGKTASPESFHKDVCISMLKDDLVFGGWICFDSSPQIFSCIAKTHKDFTDMTGFAKFSKEAMEKLKQSPDLTKVKVEPGHMLIFFEKLTHEVVSKKRTYDMYRLFTGWRLTKSSQSLFPMDIILNDQTVVPLKSGQIPQIYPKLYIVNWIDKLADWSALQVKNSMTVNYKPKSGKNSDRNFTIAQREMPSLENIGQKYASYTSEEINMYRPSKEWKLLLPCRRSVKAELFL